MKRVVREGFDSVEAVFAGQHVLDPGATSWLSIYWDGEEVVRLAAGPASGRDDAVSGVFSASKGISGIAFAKLAGDARIDLESPVRRYWPEFACHGKAAVTVAQLLSHQAGLVGVPGGLTIMELCDSRPAAEKLAAASPMWRPGVGHGYHAVTIGVFIEELFRRIASVSLQDFYEQEIRAPRDIDFYLGLPESRDHRYVPMLSPGGDPPQPDDLDLDSRVDDDLRHLAYANRQVPAERHMTPLLPNNPEVRRAGVAAVGGVGSAHGLARAYAAAITDVAGPPLIDPGVLAEVSRIQVSGPDLVLDTESRFAVVFQKPRPNADFGSYNAFGHHGAGGTYAFADPVYGLAVGWTTAPMRFPADGVPPVLAISEQARRCVRRLRALGASP